MKREDYVKLILLLLALFGLATTPELTEFVTKLVDLIYEAVCLLN